MWMVAVIFSGVLTVQVDWLGLGIGPPTHSVRWPDYKTVTGVCCRRLSLACICDVTHQGAARDGGPVVLRPVRATPCYYYC